jgi:hypothetical protein
MLVRHAAAHCSAAALAAPSDCRRLLVLLVYASDWYQKVSILTCNVAFHLQPAGECFNANVQHATAGSLVRIVQLSLW